MLANKGFALANGPANMEEIVGCREARSPLLVQFLYTITPAVTGSCFWKKNILVKPYSEFVTVLDVHLLCSREQPRQMELPA